MSWAKPEDSKTIFQPINSCVLEEPNDSPKMLTDRPAS